MAKYIHFTITAKEHLKIGAFQRDDGNESANDFIAGSAIRGALIWKWVQKHGRPHLDLLNGSLKVYPGYPLAYGDITIPMFACYGGEKKQVKEKSGRPMDINSFLHDGKGENQVPVSYHYVTRKQEQLYTYKTKMVDRLHINKQVKSDQQDGKIFRYEAIAKGESFRCAIQAPETVLDEITAMLESEIFYIGGSRGSGYGRCAIESVSVTDNIEPYYGENFKDLQAPKNQSNTFYVYFLTDTIIYEEGKVRTDLSNGFIEKKLGVKATYKDGFVNIKPATTYNAMYRTNTVCYSAVSKGSILRYDYEGAIDLEKVQVIEAEGIGLRREDGFGYIKVLFDLPQTMKAQDKIESEKSKSFLKVDANDLAKHDQVLLEYMVKAIYEKRLTLALDGLIVDALKDQKIPTNAQSQLGKIHSILEDGTRDELSDYLEHMKSKHKLKAWQLLGKIRFELSKEQSKSNLQEMLFDYANRNNNSVLKVLEKDVQPVSIGIYRYPNDSNKSQASREAQKLFLIKLVRVMIRMKGGVL